MQTSAQSWWQLRRDEKLGPALSLKFVQFRYFMPFAKAAVAAPLVGEAAYAAGTKGEPLETTFGVWELVPNAMRGACLPGEGERR